MPPILPNATVSQLFVIKVSLYFVFIYIAGVQKIEIIDFQYKFTEWFLKNLYFIHTLGFPISTNKELNVTKFNVHIFFGNFFIFQSRIKPFQANVSFLNPQKTEN